MLRKDLPVRTNLTDGTGGITGSTITVYANPIVSKVRTNLLSDSGGITIPEPLPDLPWNPSYATTQLWLDASVSASIILDGSSNVSQWLDLSGNNRHATQTNSSLRPNYAPGEVSFGGTKWFNDLASFSCGSFFAVCQVPSAKVFAGLFTGSQSELILGATGSNAITTTGYTVRINGASTTAIPIGSDYFIWSLTKSPDNQPRSIGQEFNLKGTARSWNGKCSEIVTFPETLALSQVEMVEGYLAWKNISWGLVDDLPIGHPYKTNPPTIYG